MTSTVAPVLFIQYLLSIMLTTTLAAPITITRETFRACRPGNWAGIPSNCCPLKVIEGPIVDFRPKYDASKPLRVRKALQCLSGHELQTYLQKLEKGYVLMRALPDSDLRSFKRQNAIIVPTGRAPSSKTATPTSPSTFTWTGSSCPGTACSCTFTKRFCRSCSEIPNSVFISGISTTASQRRQDMDPVAAISRLVISCRRCTTIRRKQHLKLIAQSGPSTPTGPWTMWTMCTTGTLLWYLLPGPTTPWRNKRGWNEKSCTDRWSPSQIPPTSSGRLTESETRKFWSQR